MNYFFGTHAHHSQCVVNRRRGGIRRSPQCLVINTSDIVLVFCACVYFLDICSRLGLNVKFILIFLPIASQKCSAGRRLSSLWLSWSILCPVSDENREETSRLLTAPCVLNGGLGNRDRRARCCEANLCSAFVLAFRDFGSPWNMSRGCVRGVNFYFCVIEVF